MNNFPKKFLFGAATSAYQVEGGNFNTDWFMWEQKNQLERCDLACDHYHCFDQDFSLAQSLSHNTHRLSIEWSRIEPKEGEFSEKEIYHYEQVFKSLRSHGIKIILTLHHFTLPLWLASQGGFLNRKSIYYFTRFTEIIVKKFSEYIDYWITINEPNVFASHGYLLGDWPPGKKSLLLYRKALKNIALCHRSAYQKIHSLLPESKVGIANNYVYFEPFRPNLDKFVCSFAQKYWNDHFYNLTKKYHDFLGINYYFHKRIKFQFKPPFYETKNENKIVSDLNWEIYPEGLYQILLKLKKFQLPILITENGIADQNDSKRGLFIQNHLNAISKALEQNINVRGYFHWSLLDNFEWAHGFSPRFGLIAVDYHTQNRTIRPSARVYAELINRYQKI